jgi:hypothetical protein
MADTNITPEQVAVLATAKKEAAYERLAKAEESIERAKKLAQSDRNLSMLSANLEKAQAAKAQFEERVAKFQAAKAKAEAAVKRAKEIRRRLEETSKLIKSTPPTKAGIAGLVASQIGAMRGILIAQVQKRVLEALTKFANECPNAKELQKIIKAKNNLLKGVTGLQKKAQTYKSSAGRLIQIASTVKTVITIIKQIPTPTAIIPGQVGGIGIPISVLNKYSDKLIQLDKLVDKYTNEGNAILSTVDSIIPAIDNVKNRLNSIDIAIQQCSQETALQADLDSILATAQPIGNTGANGTPVDSLSGEPDPKYSYKGYTLAILQDPNSPKIAPRRYAVAKDGRGVTVLKGQPSFSSSTDVLLDEIKFRIDNQLP